jgi:hypothetical protein
MATLGNVNESELIIVENVQYALPVQMQIHDGHFGF